MLALDFDQAKNIALLVAAGCVIGAILAIWILSSIVQKVLVALLFLLLGFAAWSQREALQDCASKVQESIAIVSSGVDTVTGTSLPSEPPTDILSEVASLDTTCTFFGTDVSIP